MECCTRIGGEGFRVDESERLLAGPSGSMMAPMNTLVLSCHHTTSMPVAKIAEGILDLDMWKTFKGWGPLPGIEKAEFERRTDEIVGTKFRVKDTRGGAHAETITQWDLPHLIEIRLDEFEKPLSLLATVFIERWIFRERDDGAVEIERRMQMTPRSVFSVPALVLIRWMMRKALLRSMRQELR